MRAPSTKPPQFPGVSSPSKKRSASARPSHFHLLERGMRAQARGNITKATRLFDEILRHYPNDTNALYLRAMLEIKKAEYEKALAFVQKCRKTHPNHAGFLYLLGYTSFQIGRYFDAIRSLKQAVKLQPDYPMAQLLLANVYRRTGRFKLGETVLSNVQNPADE